MKITQEAGDQKNGFHHHELAQILASLPEAAKVSYFAGFRGQIRKVTISVDPAQISDYSVDVAWPDAENGTA